MGPVRRLHAVSAKECSDVRPRQKITVRTSRKAKHASLIALPREVVLCYKSHDFNNSRDASGIVQGCCWRRCTLGAENSSACGHDTRLAELYTPKKAGQN